MDFYTVSDIAKLLHLSDGTVRNRIAKGEEMPPSTKVGRRRLFPVTDYEEWKNNLTLDISDE